MRRRFEKVDGGWLGQSGWVTQGDAQRTTPVDFHSRLKESLRLTQGRVSKYLSKVTVQACEQLAEVGVAFESTSQLLVQLKGLLNLQQVETMKFWTYAFPRSS